MIFLPSTPPHLPPNHQLGMLSLLPRRLATGPPPPSLVRHLSHWDWLNPPGKKYPLSLKAAPSPPADPRAYPPPPLDPTLVHVPIFEQFKDAHGEDNPHNIPPEGDEDHGRSGWGFQSRSRHEHFVSRDREGGEEGRRGRGAISRSFLALNVASLTYCFADRRSLESPSPSTTLIRVSRLFSLR